MTQRIIKHHHQGNQNGSRFVFQIQRKQNR